MSFSVVVFVLIVVPLFKIMAPYKKCPQCHTKLHIRLWACSCGYTFAIKCSKPVSPQKLSKKTEMRFIRKSEREVVSELRKE